VGQLPDGGVMEGMGLGAAGARGWGDGGHGPTPPGRIVSLGHKLGGAFEGEGEGMGEPREEEGKGEGEVGRREGDRCAKAGSCSRVPKPAVPAAHRRRCRAADARFMLPVCRRADRPRIAADANNCSCAARRGDGAAVPADGPSPPGGRW
jgi:hypothetical protein